jgi:uncharacterized protein (TIGR02271 family)
LAQRTTRASHPGRGTRDTSKDDNTSASTLRPGQRVDVPVVEEQLAVEKRTVETGQVVVHVQPRVEEQVLEVPLLEDTVEVKRVPVNRIVEGPTPVRQDGDVTVVPVFEEVLVVEKRLMLKEEIHLVRRQVATRERQTFALRKEEAHVLHSGAAGDVSSDESARDGTTVARPAALPEGGVPPTRGMEP